MIVADILPGNSHHSTQWRQTVQPPPGTFLINSSHSADNGASHSMFQTNPDDPNTYTVPFVIDNGPPQQRETRTESAVRSGPKPVHVHMKHVPWSSQTTESVRPAQQVAQTSSNTQYLSQTTRPANVGDDITIAPNNTGVVIFESDDENIPQPNPNDEGVILF